MTRLMLLDTASLYFRAFYGIRAPLRTPDGRPVNAVRGLMDFIGRLVTDYQPTHVAACWDNDWRPQWRVELLPSYKTHRVADVSPQAPVGAGGAGAESGVGEEAPDDLAVQVPMIVEALDALGVRIVGADGFEADDVIATLASTADCAVDVVTGDRDLFQLVDDARPIRIVYTAKGMSNLQVVDEAWVRAKYGIDAHRYADFAALRGDTSDGIPGVAGIGEKSAATLVETWGGLDAIIEAALDEGSALSPTIRKKLNASADYLGVALDVVRTRRDLELGVGLDDLALPAEPGPEFAALAERFGLGGSGERVTAVLRARSTTPEIR
ncbi:5'-3' exonuclease [Mariniluteicoccus flavus]